MDDFDAGWDWLEVVEKAQGKASVLAYTVLLNLADEEDQGDRVIARMIKAGVPPNKWTWNSRLKLAETLKDGETIMARMGQAEPKAEADVWTWTILLGLAKTMAEAEPILERMKTAGVTPNVVTWNTLMKPAQSLEEGEKVLARMKDAEIPPNVVTWNTLMKLAQSLEEGDEILARMGQAKPRVDPDVWTLTILLSLAKTIAQALPILDRMNDAGVTPNVVTWTTLLKLAQSLAEGEQVLARMGRANPRVEPNERTWSSLAALVQTKADADRFLANHFPPFKALLPVFTALVGRIHPEFSGEALLNWCFTWVKGRSDQGRPLMFPFAAIEPAILGYRKTKRFDDALRLILPFPYLPAATAFFRGSTYRQTLARAYFERELTGPEPHHAAYALFRLEKATGAEEDQIRWARDALGRDNQPPKRLEELQAFLAGR